MKSFKTLRECSGMGRTQFAEYFGIPYRTIQDWELGNRKCLPYLMDLMEYKLKHEPLIRAVMKMQQHKGDLARLLNYLLEHEDTDTALMKNAGLEQHPSIIVESLTKKKAE